MQKNHTPEPKKKKKTKNKKQKTNKQTNKQTKNKQKNKNKQTKNLFIFQHRPISVIFYMKFVLMITIHRPMHHDSHHIPDCIVENMFELILVVLVHI